MVLELNLVENTHILLKCGCKYFTGRSFNFGKQLANTTSFGCYLSQKNINETLYKSNYANFTLILYALV